MKRTTKGIKPGKVLLTILVPLLLIPFSTLAPGCGSSGGSEYVHDHLTGFQGPVKEDWLVRYDRSGTDWDSAQKIAVDSSGSIYVLGRINEDIAIIKYDSGGEQQWLARFDIYTPGCWGKNAVK
ncbi:MAG: hypothetical protein R6U89_02250 [Dehalococcoidia bacterium]